MKKAIKPVAADPHNIRARLFNQVGVLLTQLETGEHITLRERVAALVAIGRLDLMFTKVQEPADDKSGSTVRKYASAFSQDATGRRKAHAGRSGDNEPDDWFEHADIDRDEDATV